MSGSVCKVMLPTDPIRIHEHGHIRVIDVMGNDAAIVQAARVSYGDGTKTTREDEALIRYLMRHRHTSPFEMCEIKLHIKAPIFVARQWIRQRTASVNEVSGRYSVMPGEFYVPEPDAIAAQSDTNKQGGGRAMAPWLTHAVGVGMREACRAAFTNYDKDITQGVARELARTVLPLSTYTEWYWKIDLHNLLNFIEQRMHPHAQQEIRDYAVEIAKLVEAWCPMAWRAFEDYRLNAMTLSARQVLALQAYIVTGSRLLIDELPKRERAALADLGIAMGDAA